MAVLSQNNISRNAGYDMEVDIPNQPTYTGAVLVEQGASLHANGCTFADNTDALNGGALYARGVVSIDNCTFDGNIARFSGGAIRGGGAPMRITNSQFHANRAFGDGEGENGGGAVAYIVQGFGMDLSIESCSFTNNEAQSLGNTVEARGGGIHVEYHVQKSEESITGGVMHLLRIVDTHKHNNHVKAGRGSCVSIVATDTGGYLAQFVGAERVVDNVKFLIEDSFMTSSSSGLQGSLYTSLNSLKLQLYNVIVEGNDGGGVQADLAYGSILLVNQCKILGNKILGDR